MRAAGHVLTSDFIKQWDVGNNSFAQDPPNATISVLGSDGASVKDAVVVLKTAKLEGDQLTFDVSVLEGDLANATGPTSLFIDWFAARGGFGRVGVVGGVGFHAQCGMAPGMVIQGLHSRQALPLVPWEPLQPGRITMRLRRAAITPTHLATETTRRGGN